MTRTTAGVFFRVPSSAGVAASAGAAKGVEGVASRGSAGIDMLDG
jgi:hypothetical protein